MVEKTNILTTGSKNDYLTSIITLVSVILFTLGLYVYNAYFLEKDIIDLQSEIVKVEAQITEVESDENVQIYALLQANKTAIDTLTKRSAVTAFIEQMDLIAENFDITFESFHLSDGNIDTKATSITSDQKIAYDKVVNFIKLYREDDGALFNLGFVNGVSGTEKIAFNVVFSVK